MNKYQFMIIFNSILSRYFSFYSNNSIFIFNIKLIAIKKESPASCISDFEDNESFIVGLNNGIIKIFHLEVGTHSKVDILSNTSY